MLTLIDSLYEAGQDASLWPTVLAEIMAAMRGDSIALFAGAPDARTPELYALDGIAPKTWQAFAEYYASINPVMALAEAKLSPDDPWASHAVIGDVEFERTECYQDFYRPNAMHFMLGQRVLPRNAPSASLSIQRSKQAGVFGEREEVILRTLRPHLQRAIEVHHRFSAMEATAKGLETALEAFGQAVIGLDSTGAVTLCNRPAQHLLSAGDGLTVQQGRLRCTHPEENARLQGMIDDRVRGLMQLATGRDSMNISRKRAAMPLQATLLPVSKTVAGSSKGVVALLLLTDVTASRSRTRVMRQLYGLTPTEARLADLLLEGLDVRDAAARMNTTLETSRFHTKRVLAKTGTRRQSELVRLMAALPSVE